MYIYVTHNRGKCEKRKGAGMFGIIFISENCANHLLLNSPGQKVNNLGICLASYQREI